MTNIENVLVAIQPLLQSVKPEILSKLQTVGMNGLKSPFKLFYMKSRSIFQSFYMHSINIAFCQGILTSFLLGDLQLNLIVRSNSICGIGIPHVVVMSAYIH
jgi:hypothetical protein